MIHCQLFTVLSTEKTMPLRRLVKLPGLIILITLSLWGFLPSTSAFQIDALSIPSSRLVAQTTTVSLPAGCATEKAATLSEITIPIPTQATLISNTQGILAYQTNAPIAQLITFQEQYLPQQGWKQTLPRQIEGSSTTLGYTKANHKVQLILSPLTEKSVKTTVIVSGPDSSL